MPIMILIAGRKVAFGVSPMAWPGSWFRMDDRRRQPTGVKQSQARCPAATEPAVHRPFPA